MTACSRRVVKLGGSLLDWPELMPRLSAWLAEQPPAEILLVVGGGRRVDAIRAADRSKHLGDEAAHWQAIRAMTTNAEMIRQRLLNALCTSLLELRDAPPAPRLLVIDPEPILRHDDRALMGDAALPASWDVTSDSIAARIAVLSRASRLTLLKSALPPDNTIAAAVAADYVDRYFRHACRTIERVDCVNLRLDGFPAIQLRSEMQIAFESA